MLTGGRRPEGNILQGAKVNIFQGFSSGTGIFNGFVTITAPPFLKLAVTFGRLSDALTGRIAQNFLVNFPQAYALIPHSLRLYFFTTEVSQSCHRAFFLVSAGLRLRPQGLSAVSETPIKRAWGVLLPQPTAACGGSPHLPKASQAFKITYTSLLIGLNQRSM